MAFTILSASGAIESLSFDYNETSAKLAKYYAGLKRDTDNAINVITTSLVPNTSIAYENGSGWCSVTLGTTESNTGKPINVSCSSNTGTASRACKIYLKYDNKTTSGYIYVSQKSNEMTIRVWNQNLENITCDRYLILLCKDYGPGTYHGIVIDTLNKEIPANGYIDVGIASSILLSTSSAFYYYTNSSTLLNVNVSDTINLNDASSSFYHLFYVTSAYNGTPLLYTGGASNTYYIGTSKDTMPMNTWSTESLPASITYYKKSEISYVASYAYMNTYASSTTNSDGFWWILLGFKGLGPSNKLFVTGYKRQTAVLNSTLSNVIEAWSRISNNDTLTLAKKISIFAEASSVYIGGDSETLGAFAHGDGNLYLWVLKGSSVSSASLIHTEGYGESTPTIKIGNKSNTPEPIKSGLNTNVTGLTFSLYAYSTWVSIFRSYGKTRDEDTTRYYIPTFDMSGYV